MHLLDLEVAREYFGVLLQGLGLTVGMALVVMALSLVCAIPVALGWMSRSWLIRAPTDIYVGR